MTPAELAALPALMTFGFGLIVAAELWRQPMGPRKHVEPPREKIPDTSYAWAETIDRYPVDADLRTLAWRIKDRPNRGPAIWIHASGFETTLEGAIAWTLQHYDYKQVKVAGKLVWRHSEYGLDGDAAVVLHAVACAARELAHKKERGC